MSKADLKKGIVQILFANVLNMLFSVATNFLLPKYLSVDSYYAIKSYQLYITYVAVLHFGYNDGMYLNFGGRSLDDIKSSSLKESISTLKIFQFFMMIISMAVSFVIKDIPLLMASIAVLPQNMIACFKNFYQATGEFRRYSRIMNMTTAITFIINIFFIFIVRTDNCIYYLTGYVLLNIVLWLILETTLYKIKNIKPFSFCFSFKELKNNISCGILLLLGNFSSQLLTGMDRWFVKILMSKESFVLYAFAVSIENFLNVAVTPVSVTMYNYFCLHDDENDIINIRDLVIAFATIIVASAFPVKFLIEIFLRDYLDAVVVIFILFSAQIFYIIIKSVYVNLYKARKMQKRYFAKLIIILAAGFIFNCVCYAVLHIKEAFAIGTFISAVIWFFLSQVDFRSLKYNIRHYIYLLTETISFMICGCFFNSLAGFLIYVLITLIMLYLCMPHTLLKAKEMISGILRKVMKK